VRLGLTDKVKFLHNVPDGDLPSFYRNALCFALRVFTKDLVCPYSSNAYKCPVVVSNVSSLPEIAGTAGVYVDPKILIVLPGTFDSGPTKKLIQGKTRIQKGLHKLNYFLGRKRQTDTGNTYGGREASGMRFIIDFWVYLATLTVYSQSYNTVILYRFIFRVNIGRDSSIHWLASLTSRRELRSDTTRSSVMMLF